MVCLWLECLVGGSWVWYEQVWNPPVTTEQLSKQATLCLCANTYFQLKKEVRQILLNSPRFSLEFVECIQTQNSWARPGNVWTDLISIKRIPSVIYPCFVFRLFLTKKRQLWRKSIFSVKCFQLVNNLRLSWQWAERSVTIKISQMGIPVSSKPPFGNFFKSFSNRDVLLNIKSEFDTTVSITLH